MVEGANLVLNEFPTAHMKRTTVQLLDSSREFRAHEMFFSRTNAKGIIQASNDVFVRISGYSKAELFGQPHNIIRHPDVPRAVFRLVWDYLAEGKAVAGYVKNLAADGHYYWVVALIAPMEGGYLSVRFKPTSTLHPVVESLYRDMRSIEVAAHERGVDGEGCMNLAAEKLVAALGELGFADYDAFMDEMLQQELIARDAAIAAGGVPLLPVWTETADERGFKSISDNCQEAYRQVAMLHKALDGYARRNDELRSQFLKIAGLSKESRLVAMNIVIKAAQLGEDGRCIGVVAGFLSTVSSQLSVACDALSAQMQPVSSGLRSISFALAAAQLQLEMVMLFCHELEGLAEEKCGRSADEVDAILAAFDGTIQCLTREMKTVESALTGIGGNSDEAYKLTMAMQVAQLSGSVEASWLKDDDALAQTFREVLRQTRESQHELTQMRETISRFHFLSREAPAIVGRIIAAIKFIKQRARANSGAASPKARLDATVHSRSSARAWQPPICGHEADASVRDPGEFANA